MKYIRYIIDTSKPFTGSVQSVINDDGMVAYSDGQTFGEYNQCHGGTMRVIGRAELDGMIAAWNAGFITSPKLISEEDYISVFHSMPPSRYTNTAGIQRFSMAERLSGVLVSWYFKVGDRHFSFVDSALATDQHIDAKIAGAVRQA